MKIIICIMSVLLSVIWLAIYDISILVIANLTVLTEKQTSMLVLFVFFTMYIYENLRKYV